MKTCSKCNKQKDYSDFSKDNSKSDGYRPDCKECKNNRYQANREQELKKLKEYRQTEHGREAIYRGVAKHRARKYGVEFTPYSRIEIFERDNWTCQICKCRVHNERVNDGYKANVDHIKPISKGGDTEPSNLQTLCRNCNSSKNHREVI
ncbi:hypothetical protein QF028_004419 [Neobacillus sp. B4I6]|uniref:HNH endonuclease n=1 Tax=Neobacillus sp. B4I6 TaxID=3373925 RepID=UPI003D2093A0